MARRHIPPFETEITHLAPRGIGVGSSEDGQPVHVRGAPPGSRVAVTFFKRSKGVMHARRTAMVRPPSPGATPRCAIFGLCGGCVLQELDLDGQRRAKHDLVLRDVGPIDGTVTVHDPRGAPEPYGYRNKVELSFGVRRYLSEADHAEGQTIDGRFLGFHAPGRFDRVVDATRCELVSEAANAVIAAVRATSLTDDAPLPYDVKSHEGFWRHLMVREGFATQEMLLAVYTTSHGPAEAVERVAEAILAADTGDVRVVGVLWFTNDGVADVARGELQRTWGQATFRERLGNVTYDLSPQAFFQTSTSGAALLYDTIGEAAGRGGTLVDLYCGAGSIGLYLADRFTHIVGIEEVPLAVDNARANAAASGIDATFHLGRVEDALSVVAEVTGPRRLVVDPPRVGLHPKVAIALAQAEADVLVYVACHPASLGRDRLILEEGGWRLTDLWTVDLFPQTGHVEAVARFVKASP